MVDTSVLVAGVAGLKDPAVPTTPSALFLHEWIETAVNGRAHMLVTFNRRHFEPVAAQFGLKVRLLNVAVAEKVSALRTEEYFATRAARGSVPRALRILRRAGVGNSPMPGDELPKRAKARRK